MRGHVEDRTFFEPNDPLNEPCAACCHPFSGVAWIHPDTPSGAYTCLHTGTINQHSCAWNASSNEGARTTSNRPPITWHAPPKQEGAPPHLVGTAPDGARAIRHARAGAHWRAQRCARRAQEYSRQACGCTRAPPTGGVQEIRHEARKQGTTADVTRPQTLATRNHGCSAVCSGRVPQNRAARRARAHRHHMRWVAEPRACTMRAATNIINPGVKAAPAQSVHAHVVVNKWFQACKEPQRSRCRRRVSIHPAPLEVQTCTPRQPPKTLPAPRTALNPAYTAPGTCSHSQCVHPALSKLEV